MGGSRSRDPATRRRPRSHPGRGGSVRGRTASTRTTIATRTTTAATRTRTTTRTRTATADFPLFSRRARGRLMSRHMWLLGPNDSVALPACPPI